MSIAHKIGEKTRTGDVLITEEIDFSSLLLSDHVFQGLQNCGFERPSPIQLKAIPLGRCGLDLIVQAKSGTGKTCVFAVVSLESIQVQSSAVQVLVLVPTREIAIQIWEVIKSIGGAMPALRCHTFIGGLPLSEDKQKLKKCQIAVGSPGRIKQLIENGLMKTDSIRLFVLDEADKLLEDSFQEQINWIYSALPDNKQMLALSATYPESLAQHLTRYMRNPTFMRLNISDPALLGIRQFYVSVPYSPMPNLAFEAKTKAVIDLLSGVSFQQCLVFSNLQTRAQNLSDELQSRGWPTACIAGSHDQKDRIEAMAKLKTYKCRVLISTDLTSRGIDAEKVNLVISLDVPQDHETYLHRIGRAGRFGSFGATVTIVSSGKEELELKAVERKCNTHIKILPDPLPVDLLKTTVAVKLDDVVSTEQLITRPDTKSGDQQAANQNKNPVCQVLQNTEERGKELQGQIDKNQNGTDEENGSTRTKEETKSEDTFVEEEYRETSVKCENIHEVPEQTTNLSKSPLQELLHNDSDDSKCTTSEMFGKPSLLNRSLSNNIHDVVSNNTVQDNVSDQMSRSGLKEEVKESSQKDALNLKMEVVDVKFSTKSDARNIELSIDGYSDTKCGIPEQTSNSNGNTTGKRQIAKARRKRKIGNDKETDMNVNCNPIEEPLEVNRKCNSVEEQVQKKVDILSSRDITVEKGSINSMLSSRCRDRQQIQDKPSLTVPSLRDRLGSGRLHKPHSYSSALVDYERFLEEGESDDSAPDIWNLIKGRIDTERKTVSDNGVFAHQIKKCIDRIYWCALCEANGGTSSDVSDVSAQTVGERQVTEVSLPCVQKCSKSTQTSAAVPRSNDQQKSVRYHPMSVSSLAFVESGVAVDDGMKTYTNTDLDSDQVIGNVYNGYNVVDVEDTTECDLSAKDQILHLPTTNNGGNCSNVGKTLENFEPNGMSGLVRENLMEEISHSETVRNDCEVMYVSDCVGKISLSAEAVTVESEFLRSISTRPKSRKGKIFADLDGYEFGRLCSRQATEEQEYCENNNVNEKLMLSSEDTSDSDSSSSSSDYEKEVFCNNYVDDPTMMKTGRQNQKTGKGNNRKKSKLRRDCGSFENNYFQESYQSNDYEYKENSKQDYFSYDPSYNNPSEEDLSSQNPWYTRHTQQGYWYYSPHNYFHPLQYYPNPCWADWYSPHYYPYYHYSTSGYYPTHHNHWGGADPRWPQTVRSEEERRNAMKQNMEMQIKYIRKMAKRK